MSKYYGDIIEDDTIEMGFNTFNSSGASVTVTTFADTDIHVHKDGGLTQTTTGATVAIDYDGVTGNHLITIVTTDAFYAAGSNYEVRVEGITVDGNIINAFIGSFSIQNRFMRGTDSAALAADKGDWATATGFSVAGDAMNLAADAIKAVSYDQSTAFPMADADGTALTEAGGDGDQLTAINLPNQTMDITGNITGNLSGSVGTVAANGITATSLATDSINAASVKADAVTKIQNGLSTLVATDIVSDGAIVTVTGAVSEVGSILSNGITLNSIVANAISADTIAADAVTKIQNGLAPASEYDTEITRLAAIQEADRIIDFPNGTLKYKTKGTATVLLTKNLKDPDDAAVDSTEDVIAAEENV